MLHCTDDSCSLYETCITTMLTYTITHAAQVRVTNTVEKHLRITINNASLFYSVGKETIIV